MKQRVYDGRLVTFILRESVLFLKKTKIISPTGRRITRSTLVLLKMQFARVIVG
jgi:hypothetical protein